MKSQKKLARNLVSALSKAAGNSNQSRRLAKRALSNFIETPKNQTADLYVIFIVQDKLFVRSTDMWLADTWRKFWQQIDEWAFVEVKWYCDDHKIDAGGRNEIIKSITPKVYWIDLKNNSLVPVNQYIYNLTKNNRRMTGRQFAFLATGTQPNRVEEALRHRVNEVHGWKLQQSLKWVVREARYKTKR